MAIGSHILPNVHLADLAWNAIIAIASSAFMMTLYRKRIIRGMTHSSLLGLFKAINVSYYEINWFNCIIINNCYVFITY